MIQTRQMKQSTSITILFCSFVAALSGFLFGYHTSIIAGALLPIADQFGLTTIQQGVVVSIILIGAVAILFPAAVPFVRGFLQYRAAFANVIGSVQAVKDALPAQYRDRVNATLASSQSKSTSDLVNKVKVKAKKPTGVQP